MFNVLHVLHALQANVVGVFWELEHYPNKLIPRLPSRYAGTNGLR